MQDDSLETIRQRLTDIAELPLPPKLANKPTGYFATLVRRAAEEVAANIPEGDLSPLVRSALNAGPPAPASKRTNGGQIGNSSTSKRPSIPFLSTE